MAEAQVGTATARARVGVRLLHEEHLTPAIRAEEVVHEKIRPREIHLNVVTAFHAMRRKIPAPWVCHADTPPDSRGLVSAISTAECGDLPHRVGGARRARLLLYLEDLPSTVRPTVGADGVRQLGAVTLRALGELRRGQAVCGTTLVTACTGCLSLG